MNSRSLFLGLAAAVLPLSDAAASPPPDMPIVSCSQANWPTNGQIARQVVLKSFDQVDMVRRQIVREGRRACRRGATQVRIEFLPPLGKQVSATTP